MSYIQKLYSYKQIVLDEITKRDLSGFYFIEGYTHKKNDIIKLEKINYMIDVWNISEKFVWNEISKKLKDTIFDNQINKITFKRFIEVERIEKGFFQYLNKYGKYL